MNKDKKTAFTQYLEAESAIAPLDDVIAVLQHAYTDFYLGNTSLSQEEQFDLLHRYQTLGSILMLVINTLDTVVADFAKIRPQKEEAQTQSNPESTT